MTTPSEQPPGLAEAVDVGVALDRVGAELDAILEACGPRVRGARSKVEAVKAELDRGHLVLDRWVEALRKEQQSCQRFALAVIDEERTAIEAEKRELDRRLLEADFVRRRAEVELAKAQDLDKRAAAVLLQLGNGNRRRDDHESAHNLLRSKLFGLARQLGASITGGAEDAHVAAQFLFDRAKAAEVRPAHEDPAEVDRSARLDALAQLEAACASAADDPRPVADLVARWRRELGVEQPPLAVVVEGRKP